MKKKMSKPAGKTVSGKKYSSVLENQDNKKANKANRMVGKPADISGAIKDAKMGYSDKPRVKPQNKKGYKI
jgi:hypothetical protein